MTTEQKKAEILDSFFAAWEECKPQINSENELEIYWDLLNDLRMQYESIKNT